ncbi:MAG: aquaporin Z [Hyphomicrobiaceae bacterium]|nr:aquaporin Z [Hyphomicrobiaceae bacterium]
MTTRALGAEFIGTFALVTATCGSALFSAPSGGGLVAVAIAIGLSVLMMAYAVGHISGGHFNPAVTLGLVAGGRFDAAKAPAYIIAQVLGGIAAAAVFSIILGGYLGGGKVEFNTFAAISNNYGGTGGFSALSAFLMEVVITALFLIVIMGATSSSAPAGFAPLAIGVALMVLHLVSIPVTNASLNPARSTAPAIFAGGTALAHLWMFWVAPILGGVLGGVISRWLQEE